jgi:hypothetical protein
MLYADGGVDSAVTTRVRCVWNKVKELKPFLTAMEVSSGERKSVRELC